MADPTLSFILLRANRDLMNIYIPESMYDSYFPEEETKKVSLQNNEQGWGDNFKIVSDYGLVTKIKNRTIFYFRDLLKLILILINLLLGINSQI